MNPHEETHKNKPVSGCRVVEKLAYYSIVMKHEFDYEYEREAKTGKPSARLRLSGCPKDEWRASYLERPEKPKRNYSKPRRIKQPSYHMRLLRGARLAVYIHTPKGEFHCSLEIDEPLAGLGRFLSRWRLPAKNDYALHRWARGRYVYYRNRKRYDAANFMSEYDLFKRCLTRINDFQLDNDLGAEFMKTTEDLRQTLFNIIDRLQDGSIDVGSAKQIINASDQIVKSAALEVKYAQIQSLIDFQETNISIGRIPLTAPDAAIELGKH